MMSVEQSVEWELARDPEVLRKNSPSANSPTTNPTWNYLRSNPGRCGGKPATNRLNYGAASSLTSRLAAISQQPHTLPFTSSQQPTLFFRPSYRTDFVASTAFVITLCTVRVENTVSKNTPIFTCISFTAGTCFTEPLPRDGSGIFAYLSVVAP
jgi:hypothetical protein